MSRIEMSGTELARWADSHETSLEIALALVDLFGVDRMEGVWEAPTDTEMEVVMARARELNEDETLYWGEQTFFPQV